MARKWSKKGAVLGTGKDSTSFTPSMAGSTSWYKTGGEKEYTMNKRNPEEVGLRRAEKNVAWACKVGACTYDKKGRPIVFKI